ncbi:MAG TPA: carbohydrate kinase [Actinomycetes bacterium]|nr:carbohydrate kinase [Actinomycetes bacterium]
MTLQRIFVVGEALVDVVPPAAGRSARTLPGGSPANVAVGLSRLGVPATLATSLGADEHGRLVSAHLAATGVTVRNCATGDPPTSVARVSFDAAGEPGYDFALSWEIGPVALPADAIAVHTGSLAAAMAPGRVEVDAVMARAGAAGVTISYDPNIRPALMADRAGERARVEHQVALADLVRASVADLAWLYPDSDPIAVGTRWLAGRPALVVVTRGELGCVALTAAGMVTVPARPVRVIDPVGAGDAFTAALLAGLFGAGRLGAGWPKDGWREGSWRAGGWTAGGVALAELTGILSAAATAAALTCARPGADPPTAAELNRALAAPGSGGSR